MTRLDAAILATAQRAVARNTPGAWALHAAVTAAAWLYTIGEARESNKEAA